MKKYTRPNMEITNFDIDDIITASGDVVYGSNLTGEDADIYSVYKAGSGIGNEKVSVFTW